jgi:hypothetical protein
MLIIGSSFYRFVNSFFIEILNVVGYLRVKFFQNTDKFCLQTLRHLLKLYKRLRH